LLFSVGSRFSAPDLAAEDEQRLKDLNPELMGLEKKILRN
jgi:hypothetical protein